jgi:hypothetical protein
MPRIFDNKIKIPYIVLFSYITPRSLLFIGVVYTSDHVDKYQQKQLSFKPSTANVTYTCRLEVEPPDILKCFETIVVPHTDESHV